MVLVRHSGRVGDLAGASLVALVGGLYPVLVLRGVEHEAAVPWPLTPMLETWVEMVDSVAGTCPSGWQINTETYLMEDLMSRTWSNYSEAYKDLDTRFWILCILGIRLLFFKQGLENSP